MTARRRRVLLIEQDAFIVMLLEEAFARLGAEVRPVYDGVAALTAMAEDAYDQVVLALHPLAVPEAADLLRRLAVIAPNPLPVLVTTSFQMTAERQVIEAACTGAVAFVMKPFNDEELALALA